MLVTIMKWSVVVICAAVFSTIHVDSVKKYKFLSLETCTNNGNEVLTIDKCEIDNVYITLICQHKSPIKKMFVSTKFVYD